MRLATGVLCAALIGLASCTSLPVTSTAAHSERQILDAMFDDVVARYQLPGLALGVVRNGEIRYLRTTGEVTAGSGKPVTSATLFKIASNTKAMTTAVLARLVDAGKLRWTDPVTRHLPQFRMHDAWVTREMQVRDLLIHNSGLRAGAGDLMFWPEPNHFTRADVLAGLAHLVPAHSFRARYDYDNLLYVVAGEVAAAAGGAPYEELVRREVFEPLGLNRCRVPPFNLKEAGSVAQPHMRTATGNTVVRADTDTVPLNTAAAAGGLRCSLDDMLRWMQAMLDPQAIDRRTGSSWLSRPQRDALWTLHMPIPLSDRQRRWDASRFNGYGYGWRISDVRGALRVAHTGTLMGMYSAVVLLPERRDGFVLMINGDGSRARTVLTQALTMHLAAPAHARSLGDYAADLERDDRPSAPRSFPDVSARSPASPGALAARLGTWRDPWFGTVTLCASGEGVHLRSEKSPLLSGAVMNVGGRWFVDWFDDSVDAEAWLDFPTPDSAGAAQMTLTKVDPEADFSYDFEDLRFTQTAAGPCLTH